MTTNVKPYGPPGGTVLCFRCDRPVDFVSWANGPNRVDGSVTIRARCHDEQTEYTIASPVLEGMRDRVVRVRLFGPVILVEDSRMPSGESRLEAEGSPPVRVVGLGTERCDMRKIVGTDHAVRCCLAKDHADPMHDFAGASIEARPKLERIPPEIAAALANAPTFEETVWRAWGDVAFMREYRRLTGAALGEDRREAIAKMIDAATGHKPPALDAAEAVAFLDFVRRCLWEPVVASIVAEASR